MFSEKTGTQRMKTINLKNHNQNYFSRKIRKCYLTRIFLSRRKKPFSCSKKNSEIRQFASCVASWEKIPRNTKHYIHKFEHDVQTVFAHNCLEGLSQHFQEKKVEIVPKKGPCFDINSCYHNYFLPSKWRIQEIFIITIIQSYLLSEEFNTFRLITYLMIRREWKRIKAHV